MQIKYEKMKIEKHRFTSISYTLKVGEEVIETVTAERPLEFVYGEGYLLPKFEEALKDLRPGDPFSFTLAPADAYGEKSAEMVVDLPKGIFMIDGVIDEELLTIGNQLPMSDNHGNQMMGKVCAVKNDMITMDFNHPMAGSTLDFSGSIVAVREATDADRMMRSGGGCNCDDCGEECDEENENGCGCGCSC